MPWMIAPVNGLICDIAHHAGADVHRPPIPLIGHRPQDQQ
jgi:hypothetical protein